MATQWVKVNPRDYNLEDIVSSLEQAFSIELEAGLRVQVLRDITPPNKTKWNVKQALVEESDTWADALVTRRNQFVYVALFHEQ